MGYGLSSALWISTNLSPRGLREFPLYAIRGFKYVPISRPAVLHHKNKNFTYSDQAITAINYSSPISTSLERHLPDLHFTESVKLSPCQLAASTNLDIDHLQRRWVAKPILSLPSSLTATHIACARAEPRFRAYFNTFAGSIHYRYILLVLFYYSLKNISGTYPVLFLIHVLHLQSKSSLQGSGLLAKYLIIFIISRILYLPF